jgi:hypothetical protein
MTGVGRNAEVLLRGEVDVEVGVHGKWFTLVGGEGGVESVGIAVGI